MPDDLFGIDGLAVDHSRDLAVGAACVKADAAALHMSADRHRGVVFVREVRGRQAVHDLKAALVDVRHKLHVKPALAVFTLAVFKIDVLLLQTAGNVACAEDVNLEAADGPQKELHIPLYKAIVGLSHLGRAVDAGAAHGDFAALALNRDGQGPGRVLQIGLHPGAEGDKVRIQLRQVLDLKLNTQIFHSYLTKFFTMRCIRYHLASISSTRRSCARVRTRLWSG